MSPVKTKLVRSSFVVATVMMFASAGDAATYTWIGTGGNVSWSTTGNWGGGTPVSGTDTRIEFSDTTTNIGTSTVPLNQNIASPLQLNSLTFTGPTARVYFLSGGPLQFVVDGATQPSISGTNAENKIVSNDIEVGGGVQLSLRQRSFTLSLNGVVSGSGALVMDSQNAGGQISLGNANNSYSGGTVYNGLGSAPQFNALQVPVSGALGTGTVTLNGGNLLPYNGSSNPFPSGVSLSSGGGTTSFANTFSLSSNSSLFVGVYATSASSAKTSLSGSVLLNSSMLTLRGAGSGTIAGVVTSSGGGLDKLDSGTWALSGNNTYTGTTRISEGTLSVALLANGGVASNIGQSGTAATNLILGASNSMGTIRYTGSTVSTDRRFFIPESGTGAFNVTEAGTTLTFLTSGFSSGTKDLVKTGAGELRLNNDGSGGTAGQYVGSVAGITVSQGALTTASDDWAQINVTRLSAAGPAIELGDGAVLSLRTPLDTGAAGSSQTVRYSGLTTAATISADQWIFVGGTAGSNDKVFDVNDGAAGIDLRVTSPIAVYPVASVSRLVKQGDGTLALANSNAYLGGTVVAAGRLVVEHANGAGTTGTVAIGLSTGSAQTVTASLLTGTGLTLSRPIEVAANLSSGPSVLGGSTAHASSFTGNITLARGVTLQAATGGEVTFATGAWTTNNQSIDVGTSGNNGIVRLSNSLATSGSVNVNFGSLRVDGSLSGGGSAVQVAAAAILGGTGSILKPVSVLAGGIVAPGNSPGTLTVSDSFTLADTSVLEFELNPANFTIGGGVNDLITGVTALTLDGVLNVSGAGDWTTVPNNSSWRLFNYSGALTNNVLSLGSTPTLATGQSFQINTSTPGQVNLVIVPEPGALALAAAGVGLAGAWAQRRRRK